MPPARRGSAFALPRLLALLLAFVCAATACGGLSRDEAPRSAASPPSDAADPPSNEPLPSPTAEPTDEVSTEPSEDPSASSQAPSEEPADPATPDDPSAGAGDPSRLAFAHYFTPYGISDNRPPGRDYYDTQWLVPDGENGQHSAYGGFLRDRPIPRQPSSSRDWRMQDLQTEVAQAMQAGLNGFSLDLLSSSPSNYNYERGMLLMDAASAVDPSFRIMIMPDMKALSGLDVEGMAALISRFAEKSSAFRLDDGRLVVSPFYAEGRSASWWARVLTTLETRYATPVAFVPTFLDWRSHADAFDQISYGFSRWGERSPAGNVNAERDARAAHARGKLWMQPVSAQDSRPNQGIFDEAGNTENLRESWQAAIDGEAEWVQLVTWNDYSENTVFAPSAQHGYTWLELSRRYLTAWQTGEFPSITSDQVFLTHRRQPIEARPEYPQRKLMSLRRGSTPARNTVEVLSLLTEPSTVTVTVGNRRHVFSAPEGQSVQLLPISPGQVTASVERDGSVVADVATPSPIDFSPYVQDMQYVGAVNR